MKFNAIYFLCVLFVLQLNHAFGQSGALRFNGNDEYVQLTNQLVIGTSDFTFEVWVKPENTNNGVVFGQEVSGTNPHQLRLTTQSSRARFYFRGATSNPNVQLVSSTGSIATDEWTHLAVVRSGTTVTLYVNGVEEDSQTTLLVDNQSGSDATRRFRIGARGGPGNVNGQTNFEGEIDEFRYWNIARTQAQIQSGLFKSPLPTAAGLVIWYNFDAGSGTTLANAATAYPGDDASLVNTPSWLSSPIVYDQNAIHLDGVNDDIGIGQVLPTGSSFTKEAWIYATSTSGSRNIISSSSSPFWINNGYLTAGIGSNSSVISDPGVFPENTWVHVALTFDNPNNEMKLYRNGILVATNNSVTTNYTRQNMYIGSLQGSQSFFQGRIDEVKIWNTVRTAAQIMDNKDNEISPVAETDLVAYYTFNQGLVNGANSGMNLILDQKGNFHGLANNLSLSGSSSNFVSQYTSLAVLPLKWRSFTAGKKANKVLLEWVTENEQNTASFIVQHSRDALGWNEISSLPAAGNSIEAKEYSYVHASPVPGVNYYRLMQRDIDEKFTYSDIRQVISSESSPMVIFKNGFVTNNSLEVETEKPVTLLIYNMQGSILLRENLNIGLQRVSVSGLSRGIYIARAGDTVQRIRVE